MAESEEINLTILENALAPNALLEAEITDFGQVQRQVFNAARDGHPLTVYSILKNQAAPDKERILKECVLDADGQNCPPLVIAARNGHESVVKILLTKFDLDIECFGKVKFENYVIEGATALWCAAGAGHLSIVKLLVKLGASVNNPTKTNSTPLRAACFEGCLDIVKYLIEDGKADYNIANKFDNTCLMIAAFKGHAEVVRYLLESGVNPNIGAKCGATALHFSSETGAMDIVKILIETGKANALLTNKYGLTPLMSAAEHCQEKVFKYLYDHCEHLLSDEQKVDAYELIGGSYANDKDHYNLQKCHEYLTKAMILRATSGIEKSVISNPAYDNHMECATVGELIARANLAHKLHMEGLAIRERILGINNPELPHPIIYRGAVFADATDFDQCVALWLHALKLKQNLDNVCVVKDVLRFAQVFSQMIHLGVNIKFNDFLVVLQATVTELERNEKKLKLPPQDLLDDVEQLKEDLNTNMLTFLYLIVIFGKLKSDKEENLEAMKCIHKVVKDIQPKSRTTGHTLIHMVADSETFTGEFHTQDIVRFPCAKSTKLLIEAGIDVQIRDFQGNTPLHLIVMYQKVVGDFLTLHSIITSLIEAGAHVDVINNQGKTPMKKATTGVAEIILKSQQKVSLKCLSAQAIKRHGLCFKGHVPASLEQFINLHGP